MGPEATRCPRWPAQVGCAGRPRSDTIQVHAHVHAEWHSCCMGRADKRQPQPCPSTEREVTASPGPASRQRGWGSLPLTTGLCYSPRLGSGGGRWETCWAEKTSQTPLAVGPQMAARLSLPATGAPPSQGPGHACSYPQLLPRCWGPRSPAPLQRYPRLPHGPTSQHALLWERAGGGVGCLCWALPGGWVLPVL